MCVWATCMGPEGTESNRRTIIWGQILGQRKLKSLILSGLSETFRRLQKSAKNPEGCLIGSFYITTINYK